MGPLWMCWTELLFTFTLHRFFISQPDPAAPYQSTLVVAPNPSNGKEGGSTTFTK